MAFEKVSVNEDVIGDPELSRDFFCFQRYKKSIHTLSLHYLDTDTVKSPFIARALIKTWTFLVAKLQIILSKKWMNLRNKNNKCYQFLFSWLIAIIL